MSPWIGHQVVVAAFLAVTLLIAVSNLYTLRRLGTYPPPGVTPRVSVLVPARNEADNIGPCVASLLAQEYPNFELVVLDDNSEDRTGEILADLAKKDSRLRVLRGRPLPSGWMGKHWAAQQLSEAAAGEILLFTDADTRHSPFAVRDAVAAMLAEDADMLSGLPQEITVTWAEKLMVPVMMWGIMGFLPLVLAYRLQTPALATAIGQFMLFRRTALETVGGFASVRQEVLDDIALAREIKAHGLRWRIASARAHVRCRMYHNAREVFEGFGKNFFATLGNLPLFLFIIVWTWLAVVFLEPVAVLLLRLVGVPFSPMSTMLAAVAVIMSLFLWAISHRRFGFPRYLIPVYPASIVMAYAIAVYSTVGKLTGRAQWKGRKVAEPR